MATAMLSARAVPSLTTILPRLSTSAVSSFQSVSVHIRQLSLPLLPRISLSIPAISLNLPSLPSLGELWDGLLKAVPKKKVSHSRKRHRQMAGKALKDVTELCRCPSCGGQKRMHILCPTCAPKYTNMMADLMNAPKPKKTKSLSKMSEIPRPQTQEIIPETFTDTRTSQPKIKTMLGGFTWGRPKEAQVTIDKKGGPTT